MCDEAILEFFGRDCFVVSLLAMTTEKHLPRNDEMNSNEIISSVLHSAQYFLVMTTEKHLPRNNGKVVTELLIDGMYIEKYHGDIRVKLWHLKNNQR